jgi:hypothetical protein
LLIRSKYNQYDDMTKKDGSLNRPFFYFLL